MLDRDDLGLIVLVVGSQFAGQEIAEEILSADVVKAALQVERRVEERTRYLWWRRGGRPSESGDSMILSYASLLNMTNQ